MKFTLLEGVQEVLSSMDSDEVNSINDTVESYQVALIFKSVYYDIINDLGLVEHETTLSLEASDSDTPVLLTVPENVLRINWIKYDNRESASDNANYLDVTYKQFDEFLQMQQGLINDTSDVDSMSVSGSNGDTFDIMYRTNAFPTWYTVYDNNQIIFDAYDSSVDSVLQSSKTLCHGRVYPTFTLEDTYIPELDPAQFRYYLHKAKTRAHLELKQVANPESNAEARRQKIITQKRKHRVATQHEIYNNNSRFGRK